MKALQMQLLSTKLFKNKVLARGDKPRRVTPSVFTQEMLQSSEERLSNTTEVHLPVRLETSGSNTPPYKLSPKKRERPIFQPYPSELVFQNFIPSQTYTLPLLLLNNDKVPHHVKLELDNSEHFSVVGPENGSSKVAPGLTASYMVLFTPQENKDYSNRLIYVTARECFEIPIRGIGPSAILDFRDEIPLPSCLVKATTEKTHFVRNIGNCKAKFKLHTQSPFSVTPSSGTLDVGEGTQVTVVFNPTTVAEFQEDLILHYDTGEDVHIHLFGNSEELNICLEPEAVRLKKTYISLATSETVSLTNCSDIPLQYRWTVWPNQAIDDLSLPRDNSVPKQGEEKREENMCRPIQCQPDPTAIHHPLLLSQAPEESKSQAAEDWLPTLSLSSITIEPAEGEIWPKTTASFNIVFKPEEAKVYQHTVYCDITGCDSPLPLRIKGEGLAPKLKLNFVLMDMKNVFIGDKDHYEVQMTNKGLIDAPFRFSLPETTFGRCFSINPEEGVVPPGNHQTVEVTFHSRILGKFSEDFLLTVRGQPQPITLTFRGCVIGPTCHFNVYELNFGDVAFGFPATQTCTLFNTAFVPLTFALHVMGDGLGSPSVSTAKQVSDLSLVNWKGNTPRDRRLRPVEFTISPAAGTVDAMSDVSIKVTLCSNTVKKYELALAVDIEGVGEEVMILPLNASCVVPEIRIKSAVLDFQRCYLDLPYEQNVQLINYSNLPACYGVLDQEIEDSKTLLFKCKQPRGVLPSGSSVEISVSVLAHAVGNIQNSLRIAVFGSLQQPLEVILSCIGEGPIVYVPISRLKFGSIPVLTDVTRTLQLFNQSPIPAYFNTTMVHKQSFWRVEPSEGLVPPESQLELKIVAHLKDTVYFLEKLDVSVRESRTHTVSLSATGTGTTIVSDKPLGPTLDLGTHFYRVSYQYPFKLTNQGLRHQRMFWKIGGFLASPKQHVNFSGRTVLPPISSSRQRDTQRRRSLPSSIRERNVFSLSPACVDLPPGCSVDMMLTASSDSPKIAHDCLVCDSIIGGHGSQQTIMSVDIKCRFVAPVLSISPEMLNFYVKKVIGSSLLPVYEKLVLRNISSLSMSMELIVTEPFFLCDKPGDHSSTTTKFLVLEDKSQSEFWVCFDPSFCKNFAPHILDEILEINYLEHPQQDIVKFHAEVHFPNLHFSSTSVDFGCVQNCTEMKKTITITNCSTIPFSYNWAFLEDQTHCQIRQKADDQSHTLQSVHVEEVFDILPMYGVLQPQDQHLVTFSFYGHENISKQVVAHCSVEDGPTYEVQVRGEASAISYSLESTHLDFGSQLFHHVGEVEMCVRNTGKVDFDFSVTYLPVAKENEGVDKGRGGLIEVTDKYGDTQQLKENAKQEERPKVRPGWPIVVPAVGFIGAGSEMHLRVLYLPGIPDVFEKRFQLQVAFLPPQEIILTGVGVFPRIRLNLPQSLLAECYRDVVQEAQASVKAQNGRLELKDVIDVGDGAKEQADYGPMYEALIYMEVERLLVKNNALSVPDRLLGLSESHGSSSLWQSLSKFKLPSYVLDFGLVIPGKVFSQTVNIINSGPIPVSFYVHCKHLTGTGFTAEFDSVENLPSGETLTFTIHFDYQSSNGMTGQTSVVVPIQLSDGPVVQLQLCAVIIMPAVTVSKDMLLFDTVQCGMCQIQTIQLQNCEPVPCHWSMAEEVKPLKKGQRVTRTVFQMIPCSGVLFPEESVNVYIKFSPVEGCSYSRRLVVHVSDSTQQVFITAEGRAEEAQLEFCPSVLELGPCLPFNSEAKAEVMVKNLSSFPIEFYSLEFDTQYFKEEETLRLIEEYDENNLLLLPPRLPGEGLPVELEEYYTPLKDDELNVGNVEDESKKDDAVRNEEKSKPNNVPNEMNRIGVNPHEFFFSQLTKERLNGNLGQLKMTPVSRAIARHMDLDLSPEGLTAQNHSGIALVVYGAPLTDKNSIAVDLARHYGAACLSIDSVITDAIHNGTSPSSLSARQLYDAAVADNERKEAADAAKVTKEKPQVQPAAPESSDPKLIPSCVYTADFAADQSENSCHKSPSTAQEKSENTAKDLFSGGNLTTFRFFPPEQLLVEILTERFEFSDCQRGLVINGLESVYMQCPPSTLQVVLKSFFNRKHIFVVNLFDTYDALKKRERKQRQAEEALKNEISERQERWLWELDQETFDALPHADKEGITQRHLEVLRQKKQRDLEQKAKEEEERRLQEENHRLKDKELRKKKKKEEKSEMLDAPKMKCSLEMKQSTVDERLCEFEKYEQNQAMVEQVLQLWDRVQGLLLESLPTEESLQGSDDAIPEKKSAANKKTKKSTIKAVQKAPDVIPHIVLNITQNGFASFSELFDNNLLPSIDEIQDDLGVGPDGPPILPPTILSVVAFPKQREQPKVHQTCFTFLNPSWQDEDEEKKDLEEFTQKTNEKTAGSKRNKGNTDYKTKDKKGKESQMTVRRQPTQTKSKSSESLTKFRWVVPASSEVLLRIWFYSESPGVFEQVFNFELLGSRKLYQLTCRGVCTYPSICKEYKTIFVHCKKVAQEKEGLQKTYVIKPGYFEFGSLLCSKTRDRYKKSPYPENSERLEIHNNSGLEAEVQFSFQYDTQATTYLLDRRTMVLRPGQKEVLTIWAFPTKQGQIKDSLVCNIKDNPEPVVIHFSCWGVRPELELESTHLNFGRILLDKRDSRGIMMHNKTTLPLSWMLQGVDTLGDEFMLSQDQGIIQANSSFLLCMSFRAKRPVLVKKLLRLEVYDVEKIIGILHTENISVNAEAYDVDLKIEPAASLDFGTTRAFEEVKQQLKLTNKGKYDLAFKFIIGRPDPTLSTIESMLTVSPQSGTLLSRGKPTPVMIACRPDKEVSLKEERILSCQVIEPNIKGGEIIATIDIKISLQSAFSRYKITPACDIDFGPLVYGTDKTQNFTIENNGLFPIHFTLSRIISEIGNQARPGGQGRMLPRESASAKSTSATVETRQDLPHREPNTQKTGLNLGIFSVSPCTGNVQPGTQQQITVVCLGEQLGTWNQGLLIDISGRDPSDQPDGILYRLFAEVSKPGIVLDPESVFEEHYLCQKSSQLSSEQFCNAESIFVLDERKFIFNKVLVGQTAKARFKLANKSKVPCTLNLTIKYGGTKISRWLEVFDLSTTTLNISNQSHAYVVVTFTPLSKRPYSAVFEATTKSLCKSKLTLMNQTQEFQLTGEGTLPSVTAWCPAVGNSKGDPVIQFGRTLVGRRCTLPLVLFNDGNVVAQVQIDMVDKHGMFTIKPPPDDTINCIQKISASEGQLVHKVTARLNVNEQKRFEVSFCSNKSMSVKTTLTVQVKDNQYSNSTIHVTGEAYQEVVSLDNISASWQDGEDEVEGLHEMLNFGDCHIDCKYQESFTMTNHSNSQVWRFEWPPSSPNLTFSPQVGHLHASCSKEVTVTFWSNQPVTLKQSMRYKISQVEFKQPIEEVIDWDDCRKTVKWQNGSNMDAQESHSKKVTETDPEPFCSVVDGSQRELDLEIRAVCDYSKFSCNTNAIQFKDTMLFQTRLHQLQIINVGCVKVDFTWDIQMDSCKKITNLKQGDESGRSGSSSAKPSSTRSSVMSTLMGNPELPAFLVVPRIGTINPGVTQNFDVSFSPLEVAQFQGRLLCSIPNLQNNDQAPCITVCGKSLLPTVHFDLEDSNYVSSNRRSPKFTRSLDPSTRVLEFEAFGFSAPTTRSFNVVNLTRKTSFFKWRCEDTAVIPFRCLTSNGTLPPGKKVEMCFEYVAEQHETVESMWNFLIENQSLCFSFLCVGTAREICVYLDRPHLDFGELVIGQKVEQTFDLVNAEDEAFQFSVLQLSLLSEDQQSSLSLKPMSGTVMAKNRLPLLVCFTPSTEGYVNFKLNLKVKRKMELLSLNIKADCFPVHVLAQIQEQDGSLREIFPNHEDKIDFGKVGVNEQCSYNFLVSNLSKFRLKVSFVLTGLKEQLQQLEVKPETSVVEIGKQLQASLVFYPQGICNLKDIKLIVKVDLGPTFTLSIKGKAVAPSLDFSFTKFNFGKCFLFSTGMLPSSQTLLIHNKDKKKVSVQLQFKNTAFLEVDFQPEVLMPGDVMEVPITFYPQKTCRYNGKLTFVLDTCVTKQVDIEGRGIELKLEVMDPRQKKVKLGSLMTGQRVCKQVVLVNHSLLDLSFTLTLSTNTPLDPKDLSVSPAGELKLKSGGGSCKVQIQFSPHKHITSFSAELQAKFTDFFHPLLTIKGCCKGVQVHLDTNQLSFGAVVQQCQTSKRIMLINTGDAGARFHWQTGDFPPEVSIKPEKGYISPGKDVPFEVIFAPMKLSNEIRHENLTCFIKDSSSVKLTVTGSCVSASTSKEVVNFACRVRSSQTQSLSITNPTSEHCSIRPVVEGEQWSAVLFLIFEPNQSKTIDITYRPLTMTSDGSKHLGSVFFSFPGGRGMLFNLQGTASPPKAEDTIIHELPAKTKQSNVLLVNNWLSRQQRFSVQLEVVKPEKTDFTVFLKGQESIEVPALAKREYKLSFYAYKEGDYNTKVTFRNEATGEYLFYIVNFKVRPPGVLSTIDLETPVRQVALATLHMDNPLTTTTSFTTECKCVDIKAPPQLTVPGKSKGTLCFEYLPLNIGESSTRLTLFSNDLGHFHYNLLLKALPPPAEEIVHFQAALGNSHSNSIKFINYSHLVTKYYCKMDCPDFVVDRSVSASPGFPSGSEVRVEVCFEPHKLGEVSGHFSLTSELGGEYIFPLHGVCILPRPQGPFSIRAGGSIAIPFKNVFLQTTAFSLQVNNPCFTFKEVDSIPSKKTQNILVSFDAPREGPPGPWFGKLTICSQSLGSHTKPCSWVFYLKGQRPLSS